MSTKAFNNGFLRLAVAVPKVSVGDISFNFKEIEAAIKEAKKRSAYLVLFPEMSLTGYTLGDLFHQKLIQDKALAALEMLAKITGKSKILAVVGLPFRVGGKLFNVAAFLGDGGVLGLVPKRHLPGYKEFYEERWFANATDLTEKEVLIGGRMVPIGTDLLFKTKSDPRIIFGVEICEDLWTPLPPSSFQSLGGATIILNPSASNELVGKADYRRTLVINQSARAICGYLYSSCGVHESTTDLVFSGHAIVAENGRILAESGRFSRSREMIFADLDLDHLIFDRVKMTSFGEGTGEVLPHSRLIDIRLRPQVPGRLDEGTDSHPFVPGDLSRRAQISEEIFNIQAAGLAKRVEQSGCLKMLLGLSGGLDSTLAFLVCVKTAGILGLPLKNIHVLTMPGFGTTKRTKLNATKLAKAFGVTFEEIDITAGAKQQLRDIRHSGKENATFENVQARYRTMTLMNKANELGGMVVGTGDLSEIALGWNTFTGDHISHYDVNAGVPKTLVNYLIEWVSETEAFAGVRKVLKDILATPISPELLSNKKGEIGQKTEELVGPYELHDFFLYHFVRWGSGPRRILFLAENAFRGKYQPAEVKKWLRIFVRRFFANQWKRSVMPDGPKVGSVALSPRGDWRMPSDAEVKIWLRDLNEEV